MCLALSVPPLLQTLSRVAETSKLTIQPGFNVGTRAYIIYTHTHWVVWSYIGYPPTTGLSTANCQFKCSVTYDKTKYHRSPSLKSYNISEIDVNSIKSNQIQLLRFLTIASLMAPFRPPGKGPMSNQSGKEKAPNLTPVTIDLYLLSQFLLDFLKEFVLNNCLNFANLDRLYLSNNSVSDQNQAVNWLYSLL